MTGQAPVSTASALVRHWARTTPEAIAYTFEGEHTSWEAFDAEVDAWARLLLHLGVEAGQGVAFLAGNHPDFLRLAFACTRVSAHIVPLNTWHRGSELAYTIEHSDAVALFAVSDLRKADLAATLAEILPIGAVRELVSLRGSIDGARDVTDLLVEAEAVSQESVREREEANDPHDLMYLLYTSGSTAKPKSVILEQGDMIENCFHIGARQGLTGEDRTWLATPLFYGLSAIQGLFSAWTHGGRVVLQEIFEPVSALAMLEREQCTAYYGFGNLTRKMLAVPGFDKSRLALRKGMIGFSYEDRMLALDDLGITHGTSVYGLTECYPLAALTAWNDPAEVILATQGFPLPDQEILIVDPETEEPLAAGETGSVLVRGRVTPGYYKDPERTAQTIRPDGFFRTGDLGRFDEAGRFVYQSRASEMMKPAGINVSPYEVEDLLDAVPGIRQAHVCAIPDDLNGERVVAFVEVGDPALGEPEIRAHVAARAASYKVPSAVFVCEDAEIPRLSNGKVSRPQLVVEASRRLQDPT